MSGEMEANGDAAERQSAYAKAVVDKCDPLPLMRAMAETMRRSSGGAILIYYNM